MQPILEMRGITKTFPGVRALDNVNLTVMPGEIHAIVGENGAGKSTLMKVLSGVYAAGSYEGEILFEGEVRHFRDLADSERLGIVIIHQELALVPLLSIAENIFLGNEIARRGVIDWEETFAHTEELLRKVGLRERPTTLVTDIGVGKQQLVEIAKALSKKVKLLILDEPTASLQETDSQKLLDLLIEFKPPGDHLDPDQPQAERDRPGRRPGHRTARRRHRLDARRAREAEISEDQHHPRHGRPADVRPLSAARAEDRRADLRGRGVERLRPGASRPPPDPRREPRGARGRDRRHRRA